MTTPSISLNLNVLFFSTYNLEWKLYESQVKIGI